MGEETPGPDMTATFGGPDHDDAGTVTTADADIADWAGRHGYIVRTADHTSGTVYRISPGDAERDEPSVP
jgi:hypothetical protein